MKKPNAINAFLLSIAVFVLGSCVGSNDRFIENFESFETEKLDTIQYRFLNQNLVHSLHQGISYKFKDNTIVSFVKGKAFTLLSFNFKVKNLNKSRNLKLNKVESKTRTGYSYLICKYMGVELAFRPKNNPNTKYPILNVDADNITKKIVNSKLIFIEGYIKNVGIYLEDQEYIFMPYDQAFFVQKQDLYIKLLIVKNRNNWTTYLFYAHDKFKTKVLKGLKI